MSKIRSVSQVMTHAVATCSPDSSVQQVAKLMHDLNIGDVLIVDNDKVRGIITDRDIAVRVVATGEDPKEAKIKDYMTKEVVTGRPDWDLDKVADTMAKHQIRRLPLIENERLVGIVSLGDVARHKEVKSTVGRSLRSISEPAGLHQNSSVRFGQILAGLLLATITGGAITFLMMSQSGRQIRERLAHEVESADLHELLQDAREKLETLSAQLAELQPKLTQKIR